MAKILSSDAVIFADDKTEKAFNSLSEEDKIKKAIKRAIEKLKENAFSGEKIKKKLIPKDYIIKYNIDNLFWYKLTKDWRLVYSVVCNNIEVLAIIIEYYHHKDYEKRFGY